MGTDVDKQLALITRYPGAVPEVNCEVSWSWRSMYNDIHNNVKIIVLSVIFLMLGSPAEC